MQTVQPSLQYVLKVPHQINVMGETNTDKGHAHNGNLVKHETFLHSKRYKILIHFSSYVLVWNKTYISEPPNSNYNNACNNFRNITTDL